MALVLLGIYGQAMLTTIARQSFSEHEIRHLIRIVVEGIGGRPTEACSAQGPLRCSHSSAKNLGRRRTRRRRGHVGISLSDEDDRHRIGAERPVHLFVRSPWVKTSVVAWMRSARCALLWRLTRSIISSLLTGHRPIRTPQRVNITCFRTRRTGC
jgi:hypothetical protein